MTATRTGRGIADVVRRAARRVTPIRFVYSEADALVRYWPAMRHDGLGSSVLLQALARNGENGRLIGIDIDPSSGRLVPPRLRANYDLVIADSAEALPRVAAQHPIDLLIVDGDHGYEHKRAEYAAVLRALSPSAILVSDTSQHSSALRDFADEQGRTYRFWSEQVIRHFFGGAGIGLSLPSRALDPTR